MSGTRRVPGGMAPYVEGFAAWLTELGYTPGTIRNGLKAVGQLGRWLESERIEVSGLRESSIEQFVRSLHASRHRRVPSVRSFRPLLEYLRTQGVLTREIPMTNPVGDLLANYRGWLIKDRGLAAATVLRYENLARRFLEERYDVAGSRFVADLKGVDVVAFLVGETTRVSVGTAKGRVAEVRSLLRFLYVRGLTTTPLAPAVPPVAGWRDTAIPRGPAATEVEALLAGCDRSEPAGIRDFAILMLVARLGLRSIEVARLELGDIDWRAGEIVVRGKAGRQDRLPLPVDVGEALSAYLREVRPSRPIRQVFLALKAPTRAIRADLVSDVTRRACARAGLSRVGAHRLRHGLATDMLRRGATLVEVSQVLRHRDLATTAIYAKVELPTLRRVAQPWPRVGR